MDGDLEGNSKCCDPPVITEVTKLEFFAVKNIPSVPLSLAEEKELTIKVCEKLLSATDGPYFLNSLGTRSTPKSCDQPLDPLGASSTPFSSEGLPTEGFEPQTTIKVTYKPTTDSDTTLYLCLKGLFTSSSKCGCNGCSEIELVGHSLKRKPSLDILDSKDVSVEGGTIDFSFDPSSISPDGQSIILKIRGNGSSSLKHTITDVRFSIPGLDFGIPDFNIEPLLIGKNVDEEDVVTVRLIPIPQRDAKGNVFFLHATQTLVVRAKTILSTEEIATITIRIVTVAPVPIFSAPTTTQWGVIAMAFLIMTAGTIFILRKKKVWRL